MPARFEQQVAIVTGARRGSDVRSSNGLRMTVRSSSLQTSTRRQGVKSLRQLGPTKRFFNVWT